MKNLLFASLLIFNSHLAFSLKGGSGAGNGGLGYICQTINPYNDSITLALDIAENIPLHYSDTYFSYEYDQNNNMISNFMAPFHASDLYPLSYSAIQLRYLTGNQKKLDNLFTRLKSIIKTTINLDAPFLRDLLSPQQISKAKQVKKMLISKETKLFTDMLRNFVGNKTKDEGILVKPESFFQKYKLKNCRLTQIAILKVIQDPITKKEVINLFFSGYALQFIDDYNLEAIFWHEILYLASPDTNSHQIRETVSEVMLRSR